MANIRPTQAKAISKLDSENKPTNLVLNLINDFGGPLAIIAASESVLSFASKLFKNPLYQKTIGMLKLTLPAAIVGYKIYDSAKNYYENKGENVSLRKNHKILKLMKFSPFDYDKVENSLNSESIKLGSDLILWLLRSPQTNNFKLIGYYDENFNATDNPPQDKGVYYVLIEKDNSYNILELELAGLLNNKLLVISSVLWYINPDYEYTNVIKKSLILDFISNFNTVDNTIIYSPNGVEVRAKINVDYEINQFDVYELAREIVSVINKKKKRGYIFAGIPGTGKSSIILKLESLLKDYPILYVSKSSINYNGDLNEVFSLINTLSPCIVIFEDLDCFGFSRKGNRFFNEFLAEIDNVYQKYNTVIIATVNDTGDVHQSLINRPGRFDQVFMINPPKTVEEVYTVMNNKYFKSTKKQLPDLKNMDVNLLNKIISNNFTQADICEIIEKIIISDKEINNESLQFSITQLENSKNAIKACSFNTNPDDEEDY